MKNCKIDWYLLALLFVASVIRIPAVSEGLPAAYNSTEYFLAKIALTMGAERSIDPGVYIYPTLYPYLLVCFYSGYYLIGHFLGFFTNVYAFAVQFLTDPSGFYILARFFNVILFLLILVIVYFFLKRYASLRIARLAAVMVFLSSYLYQYSSFGTADTLLILFSTLTIIYFYKLFEDPSHKNILLTGIFTGLAIAVKYNAGFLIFGLFFVVIMLVRIQKVRLLPGMGFSLAGILAGFLVPNPLWLIYPQKFWEGFRLVSAQMYSAVSAESGEPFIWEIVTLIQDEYILGTVFLISTIYFFLKGEKRHIPAVVVILLTYLYVGSWSKKGLDYLFPVFPAWIILGSFFVDELMDKYMLKKHVKIILLAVLFLPSLVGISTQCISYLNEDTREQTTEWILENIQRNEIICYDNSHNDLGIFDINRFISYGIGSDKLPQPVKKELVNYKNHPRQINFMPIIIPSPSCTLKTANPYETEAVKYRRRNLRELINLGTDYLITNRRYFESFLLTNMRDYPMGVQIGIQEVREFYQQLFKFYEPIKTIKPSIWSPGPEIQIYDLHQMRQKKSESIQP